MSLINNRNEESTPEFEVISGGKEDVRSSFADRTEQEAEIDLIDLAAFKTSSLLPEISPLQH